MARNGRIGGGGRDAYGASLLGSVAAAAFMAAAVLDVAGAAPFAAGADPIVTGAIDSHADARRPAVDSLIPAVSHFSMRTGSDPAAAPDEIGVLPPDMPVPVAMPAPDLATLIGARLLGENALDITLPRPQREAIVRAYEARGFAPLWIESGTWSAAARAVFPVLAEADTHGLSPVRYAVPAGVPATPAAAAEADIKVSAAIVAYARDARGARVNRNTVGTLAMPALVLPEADAVLDGIAAAGAGAAGALTAYHPRAPQYHALRQKLIELRGQGGKPPAPPSRLSQGPTITVGMRDERVPLIRARLGLSPVDDIEDARLYDARLAEAVSTFQKERGLPGDGAVNRRTVLALAGAGSAAVPVGRVADTARLEAAIRINMERWRWFPHDLGERHILANIPEQDVKIVEHGRVVHSTRGIIGTTATPTPVFSDTMTYVVLNPSWYVPPSIIKKQFVPGLARDPQYAARRGYEVTRRGNSVSVRQPPGPNNALGRIKFMFPNDLAIYLHDTPNRSLFQQSRRALSNGCIRVENPMKLAEQIMGNGWTENRLNRQVGGREQGVRLETPLPIHLTYFTLDIDPQGTIRTLPDVYGYDQRLGSALAAFEKQRAGL